MPLSVEDKVLIKNLHLLKGYGWRRLMAEFPQKNWNKGSINSLIRKVKDTGSTSRRVGSGRPKSARTDENITAVKELILSQEDRPQTHRSTRQISREIGLAQSSVVRIIRRDLKLKCFKKRRAQELSEANRQARLIRCRMLLKKYSTHDVSSIWFSDEKVFTVATPRNPQNDRVYAPTGSKKRNISAERLLRTRTTFTQSIMVSLGISKLGCTNLIFVEPGVKINGQYYRDVLLKQDLLPAIRQISGDYFIFQQDSAPAHRARDTITFMERETPAFIAPDLWPPNSPDLNPLDYKIWGILQQRIYQRKVNNIEELKRRLIEEWCNIQQSVIDTAIDEWRSRLHACVRAYGGRFEHKL